jgi:hypothetical protein
MEAFSLSQGNRESLFSTKPAKLLSRVIITNQITNQRRTGSDRI